MNAPSRARTALRAALLTLTTWLLSTPAHADAFRVTYLSDENKITVRGEGAVVTLADLSATLSSLGHPNLVLPLGNREWLLNANLYIAKGVTLRVSGDEVAWLKLRSTPAGFVWLRTYDGVILLDRVKVTSWNPDTGDYDHTYSDGRAYVLAKYEARLDIITSQLSYLGYNAGEAYGVSWRDIGTDVNGAPYTRVTGRVINSAFSHNYYGVYTYQAAHMLFRGNRFHHNVEYGFDPHDHTHHVTVVDNEAYENGNHGFIISRGCNNFYFVRNRSHHNANQGFMLDPGSPNAEDPQSPSWGNVFRGNRAWDNTGYGLRILGSHDNLVEANRFDRNKHGVTVEASRGNVVRNNILMGNRTNGIYLLDHAEQNTIARNMVGRSGQHGIRVTSGARNNMILSNRVRANGQWGISANGTETRRNTWRSNRVYGNLRGGIANEEAANDAITAPVVTEVLAGVVRGTAMPGAVVDVFSDAGTQAQFLEGHAVTGPDGRWELVPGATLRGARITATATDANGNSSALSPPRARP
ncbi:MAG: right-handed parallel beta-helix repeat-containing protein [Myxococcota bacterium]